MSGSNTFSLIALFALSAMVVNSIGIWVIYKNKQWVDRNIEYFMCFAAGVLIASPLIIAFPEALEKNADAGMAALAGFIFMFFSNKYIKHRTQQDELWLLGLLPSKASASTPLWTASSMPSLSVSVQLLA